MRRTTADEVYYQITLSPVTVDITDYIGISVFYYFYVLCQEKLFR